jgi:hypothetical protein
MRRSTEQRYTARVEPVEFVGLGFFNPFRDSWSGEAARLDDSVRNTASSVDDAINRGIESVGQKLNIGESSDEWKKWAEGSLAFATGGFSLNKDIRAEVKRMGEKVNIGNTGESTLKSLANLYTLGASDSRVLRDEAKRVGEKWNVGNNSIDTLKSVLNVASIAASLTGVGTLASALLGSSSMTQAAMTVAREYAREELKDRIVGKVGQELADPYIDHLVKKARRDRMALNAQEQEVLNQYREARPGVYEIMLRAVENPNALSEEEMQLVVNYQRDVEDERAMAMNQPPPPEEEWFAYYTRFLAEYGVTWQPTEKPGAVRSIGGGLPPASTERVTPSLDEYLAVQNMSAQRRQPMSLNFSPELKAALDSLYPITR